MKKKLCILLCMALLLALVGCNRTAAPNHNTEPDTRPGTEPSAELSTTPDTVPGTEPETIPDTTPGTEPDTVPGTEPDTAPGTTPDTAPATEPGTEPGTTPDTKPGTVPSTEPSTAPNTVPSTRPSTAPDTVPITKPGTAPNTAPGTKPSTAPTTAPGTKPSTAPNTVPSTKPSTAPNTVPSTKPGTTPSIPVFTRPSTTPNAPTTCAHIWGQWVQKAVATCTKAGVQERACVNCGKTEFAEVAKVDHKESDWIIDKAATVDVEGKKHTECVYCQKTFRSEIIPKLPPQHTHSAVQSEIIKEATCTETGSKNIICFCGAVMETRTVPSIGHKYSDTVVRPTPTVKGYTLHTCTACGDNYKDTYTEFGYAPTLELTYKSNGDGTCAVTGISDKTVAYVIIPEKSPAGDTVVSIANDAFKNNEALVSVEIPDTVTYIGQMTFERCKNLKTVRFPKTGAQPLVLGLYCFNESGIEAVDMSQTYVETITAHAFYGCKSLKTVKLKGVTTVGNFAFMSCTALTSVIHTGELNNVGERAFYGCTALTVFKGQNSAHNLDTVQYLYDGAFSRSGIRDIVFHKDLKSNGTPFSGCSYLGTVDCTQIGYASIGFTYSSIGTIYLSPRATQIASYCFEGVRISELVIPDSVTKIGSGAFRGAQIGKIVFGSGLTAIDTKAFQDARITTYDFSKVTKSLSIGSEAFANNQFTTFAFPDSTVGIGKGALKGCTSLKTLTIPFIAGDAGSTNSSKDCFGWLFDASVNGIDVWDQDDVVPHSLKTLIVHGNDLGTRDLMGVGLTDIVIGTSVTSIGADNFEQYVSPLQRVFYEGTQAQWNSVAISGNNQKLTSAQKYFYSETRPTTSGNYWHYDSNGNIAIW